MRSIAAGCGAGSDGLSCRLSQFEGNAAYDISYRANDVSSPTPRGTEPSAGCSSLRLSGWRHLSYGIVWLDLGTRFVRRAVGGDYASRKAAPSIGSERGAGSGRFEDGRRVLDRGG